LEAFLQEISLMSDADTLKANQEAVTLMTVHSAKGLEFPRVFVTGLEDGLFPMVREGDDDEEVEEERRLFYVAATRARQDLCLTYARRRRRYGGYQDAFGSRFLREIDKQYLETPAAYAPRPATTGRGSFALGRTASEDDPMPRYEDLDQDAVEYRPGQNVRHAKFGMGKVARVDGTGEAARVDVVFGDHIRRTLMLKFAKLEAMD
jgi:DNA helicase-2/ATP-dependent DNA helicase PcrA